MIRLFLHIRASRMSLTLTIAPLPRRILGLISSLVLHLHPIAEEV